MNDGSAALLNEFDEVAVRSPTRDSQVAVVAASVILLVVLVRTAWIDDDSYITFRTIDNFLNGYGLRWNVANRVQTFTHPLWMLVMTAAMSVTREAYFTSLAVSMAISLAASAVLVRFVGPSLRSAILLLSTLVLSKSFVEYSTSGLENPLTHLLLALFFAEYFTARPRGPRLVWLASSAGLLMLNRIDAGLLALPALASTAWQTGGKRSLAPLAIGFAPLMAWECFAVIYYGFPFPNTAYAKFVSDIPRSELWHQGVLYFFDGVSNDPLTMLVILAGVTALIFFPRRWTLPAGITLYLAYIVWIGGDFMSGRFFAAPFLVAVIHLARLPMSVQPQVAWPVTIAVVWLVGMMTPHPPILSGASYRDPRPPGMRVGPSGIVDERRYYYAETGLLTARRGASMPNHKWLQMGFELAQRGEQVFTTDAAGFIGYAAGPGVHLLDLNGLGDALLAHLPNEVPWRVGHYQTRPPDGYDETIKAKRNLIRDLAVAAYYEKIRLITEGPIWSRRRFAAVLWMNLGRYDHFIENYDRVSVPLAALDQPKADGAKWDAEGNIDNMGLRGVEVALAGGVVARHIELSVSNNDTYRLVFMSNDQRVGEHTITQPATPGGEMQTHLVPGPMTAIDRILVLPSGGDACYSVRHMRMII